MAKDDKTLVYLTIIQVVLVLIITFQVAGIASTLQRAVEGVPQGAPDQPNKQPQQPTERVDVSVDDDAVKGAADAPVTIVEFSDYQCPFCQRFWKQTLPQIEEQYIETGKVKFVYRDFPLSFHPQAHKAAEAAECASEQDAYWEMHDALFKNQNRLGDSLYGELAGDLGLDVGSFNDCLTSGKYADEVDADFREGQSYGVTGTPGFFVNGKLVSGAQPFSVFKQVIDAELAK